MQALWPGYIGLQLHLCGRMGRREKAGGTEGYFGQHPGIHGKIITELESEVDEIREREALKPDTALFAEDDFEF